MKILTYQRQGCMQGKKEMEDRITVGKSVLASGYHCCTESNASVFAVFDGVGGLKGSAFASTLAARAMADLVFPITTDTLKHTLEEIHNDLINYSNTATTATGIAFNGNDQAFLFHIGNTRISGLSDGYIRPLTEDQTRFEFLRRDGLPADEIPQSGKATLMACLGVRSELIHSLVVTEFHPKEIRCEKIMITSDGIHDCLTLDELEGFLNSDITETTLVMLADSAVQAGSQDDMSIIVIEI